MRGGEDWKNGWTEAGGLESYEVRMWEGQGTPAALCQMIKDGIASRFNRVINPEYPAWNLGVYGFSPVQL